MEVDPIQASASQTSTHSALSRSPREEKAGGTSSVPGVVPHGTALPEPQSRESGAVDAIASVAVRQEFPPNTRLHLDEESNRIVAQILDENNEVVRQLPPQELLDISARFNRLQGILFDEQR